ncbi:MAG: hypothetical protein L0I76_07330 [Pseudonocardia sp.]|nr:hypothetical protein [Pseudonocardia sp.]
MNSHNSLPRRAHTSHHDSTGPGAVVPVTRLVHAGLNRAATAISQTSALRPTDDLGQAARARRLCELHTRRARWWAILRRVTVADLDIPAVYLCAVAIACVGAEGSARFWRDAADDWQARAEHRPTSDVAGAMSNWHELGLTEPPAPGLPAPLAEAAP